MPGSVAAANPTTVLPFSLSIFFERSQEWAVDKNRYRNGEVQADDLVSTSRKRWKLRKGLSATDIDDLRTFFLARNGGTEEFFFYDVWETSPIFSYDETGVATAGRYTVVFDGDLQEALGIARSEVTLGLREVA